MFGKCGSAAAAAAATAAASAEQFVLCTVKMLRRCSTVTLAFVQCTPCTYYGCRPCVCSFRESYSGDPEDPDHFVSLGDDLSHLETILSHLETICLTSRILFRGSRPFCLTSRISYSEYDLDNMIQGLPTICSLSD